MTLDALSSSRDHRMRGIALMCIAVICFNCLDTTAKYLSATLPVLQVVWTRYLSAFALALIPSNPVRRPGLMRTSRPWMQVVRALLLVSSTLLNFISLQYLQLDEAVAIVFSTPFFVAALSGPLLGEWIGWRRWIAITVGFVGVLVVMRPGMGGLHPAAMFTVASIICYAFYLIMTRMLARTDSNETTLFYSNLVGASVMSLIVPFAWVTPPDWFTVMLMIVIGAFGSAGHYMLIAAHRHAPAAVLAPFVYGQLVSAVALGYFVFGDIPNRWTIAGSLIVIASGLYLINYERLAARALRQAE